MSITTVFRAFAEIAEDCDIDAKIEDFRNRIQDGEERRKEFQNYSSSFPQFYAWLDDAINDCEWAVDKLTDYKNGSRILSLEDIRRKRKSGRFEFSKMQ